MIPVPRNNIDDYRRIAQKQGGMARPWRLGIIVNASALDLDVTTQVPFQRLINSTPDETVVLAWIAFKSRAHRDEVNAKVMKDPRLAKTDPNAMPFDCQRMAYGAFDVLCVGLRIRGQTEIASASPKPECRD